MSTRPQADPYLRPPVDLRAGALLAAVCSLALLALAVMAVLTALGGSGASDGGATGAYDATANVTALARGEIPALYLRLYQQAAARYGLDWAILAGIGKVECDHGRDPDPACTQEGAVNSAGAGGPMQFVASTWARYGVDADGHGGANRWDPADAIFSAANYLRASGAPGDYERALLAYNDAAWYVAEVRHWARLYGGASAETSTGEQLAIQPDADAPEGYAPDLGLRSQTSTPVRFIAGERAELAPGDGHVALIPTDVPAVVEAMIVAGNELEDLPYGPGGHPDPLGATEEDCSSTVNYVLYRSGVRTLAEILNRNPLAQDYVSWGAPGPGRWVTIYATDVPTPHVFIVIAGLRLDTSYAGTDVGPNRDESGPRWRILDHIPTWAHWSVRHPPGL